MKRPDLVLLAAEYAGTHPSEIFRAACVNNPKLRHWNLGDMACEYHAQTALGRWDEWVEDFCIYLLAGRLPVFVTIPEVGVIYCIRPMWKMTRNECWKRGQFDEWEDSDFFRDKGEQAA